MGQWNEFEFNILAVGGAGDIRLLGDNIDELPGKINELWTRGKGSTQILNLQIAVQKYPFKVRNSSKYRLRHSCTKTNIFC